ncbi:MAG TPA: SDR family oxidoreductase [Verrucomicrobiae bacterium]|nr:SDR family oxidoreductase [Verrucomicrobiae bacterium]
MNAYQNLGDRLQREPKSWLVTGAAGFIGSNLVEALLKLGQKVVGLDNYSSGRAANLQDVRGRVTPSQWKLFSAIKGDIRNPATCKRACRRIDFILHQAALGSVPLSITRPLDSHENNVTGFLNILMAAKQSRVRRCVFASSCAVYGNHPRLPKVEEQLGESLSPYAVTKRCNELYADIFARCYGLSSIGLRYFNVFGPRQDPKGAYAAVIPHWIAAMMKAEPIHINGDGKTTRDFCYIANVVQANLLAATTDNPDAINQLYNVAGRRQISLNELFEMLRTRLLPMYPHLARCVPIYRPFREGDIRHSEGAIDKAARLLGYQPTYQFQDGLDEALPWYVENFSRSRPKPKPKKTRSSPRRKR